MNLEANNFKLQTQVPLSVYQKVENIAAKEGVSMALLIREWIIKGLKE